MTLYTVTSEILTENENICENLKNGNAVSTFVFKTPSYMIKPKDNTTNTIYDDDDDLDVNRDHEEKLLIEHRTCTELKHVGLQIWRGALLLADYILSNPNLFKGKRILELGSGVGLTSIVASFLAKEVICTDVNLEGILPLMERNFMRNSQYIKSQYRITELDFLNLEWSASSRENFESTTIILAADVIYDDKITEGFVRTLGKLLNSKLPKVAYIALEKRYVFTVADMDSAAPMYEEFLRCIKAQKLNWSIKNVKLDFPRYFQYDRVKQMILLRIRNK